ncbi:hypothetical protein GCM10019059_39450 [Camelimonas fluminis]|uniref:Glutathione S-transferase N-terminal domain-containing protein n=1 Tax=Camelimonas fluminis TaxID=1576911 RepID=A0ABV7UNV9_9HYPH|nr:glutathione S-transferase N-terminal domain-containing protein [Camelimonas fluminis]GHE76249.1 hypothetical protein GCM10019059_39450 [Camelimonas fluminis]
MTTLFYMPGACSLAPHIVLEWIGAPFEAKRVRREAPELLAVNPAGAVPVLVEDDGWSLTQAGAILDYLAHKHPEADLLGGKGLRRRRAASVVILRHGRPASGLRADVCADALHHRRQRRRAAGGEDGRAGAGAQAPRPA